MIEDKLKEEISKLEKEIEHRETKEWQSQERSKQMDNEYVWRFCGEREEYQGRLQGLKHALSIIQGEQ